MRLKSLLPLGVAVACLVGVYSTKQQWQAITGGLDLGLPTWIAGYDTHEYVLQLRQRGQVLVRRGRACVCAELAGHV